MNNIAIDIYYEVSKTKNSISELQDGLKALQ